MTPKTATEMMDLLLYRTRSMGGTAFSQALTMQILSLAQSTTQAFMKRMTKSATLVVLPAKLLYDVQADLTDCIQVNGIEDEYKELAHAKDWKELSRVNSNWLTVSSQRPNMFAQIGYTYIAITPTPKVTRNVTVNYVYETPVIDELTDAMTLPDEDLTFCLDLAETVLLTSTARGQKLTEATAKIKQFMQRAGQVSARVKGERNL